MLNIGITVAILTKNSEETIGNTLVSLERFSEIIVLDTGSTDSTVEIARRFPNVRVFVASFSGFGSLRNQVAALASNSWILSVDADEVLTSDLASEIQRLSLDPACVYSIRRENYLNGRKIWFCSWYPDRVIRLYHRDRTQFSDAAVHEQVITQHMRVVSLLHTVRHTPYRSISEFLEKMEKYSTLFAQDCRGKKASSFLKACLHGAAAFIKNYFFKWGFLGGKEGLMISLYNSQTTYYKYLKLAELNKNL